MANLEERKSVHGKRGQAPEFTDADPLEEEIKAQQKTIGKTESPSGAKSLEDVVIIKPDDY